MIVMIDVESEDPTANFEFDRSNSRFFQSKWKTLGGSCMSRIEFKSMRSILKILVCLALGVPSGAGEILQPRATNANAAVKSCCCCADSSKCACGCGKTTVSSDCSSSDAVQWTVCSCDAVPTSIPLSASVSPTAEIKSIPSISHFAGAANESRSFAERCTDDHIPSGDSVHLRTFILII